jgi:CBS domain-containing protein
MTALYFVPQCQEEDCMRARDLMTADAASILLETPVPVVARGVAGRGISSAPVVDGAGRLAGMVTAAPPRM